MVDNSSKHNLADQSPRSFVVSDFSWRDVPEALVAFIVITIASILLGLFAESISPFWRGFLFGIAVTLTAVVGVSMLVNASRARTTRDETR